MGELGTWGLSNDEAWVALSTRVEGADQWWLAVSMTPVAWAALVKLASLVSSHEASLRAVPFLFGCLTMVLAFRVGARFAGHALGGVLALAVVAFDPLSIAYAKILKQYTAEAFFCLLAFDRAAVFAERPARRELVLLAFVLVVGIVFANAQLLVAPPILAALILDAGRRRDGRALRDLVLTTAGVGACAGLYHGLVVAPRLPPASDPYWAAQAYVPVGIEAPKVVWTGVSWTLARALGARAAPVVMACLAAVAALRRPRVVVVALMLLVLEVVGLSMLRIVALSQPRILLFLTTALITFGAAAIALVVVRAWVRPALGVVATVALAAVVYDFVQAHGWRDLGRSILAEDAGPLVQRIERERRPDDTVLVHQNTGYIFAYYQRATPILDAFHGVSVGYVPRPPDERVVFVTDQDLEAKAGAALRAGSRVWFVASRLRVPRERRVRDALARVGPASLDQRRPGAFLLLLAPSAPATEPRPP